MLGKLILVVVLAAIVLVALRVFAERKRTKERDARAQRLAAVDAPGAQLRSVRVGDVVGMDGAMWAVVGALRFDEDGFTWSEFLLSEGERREWLSVEDEEGVPAAWRWSRAAPGGLEPAGSEITFDGMTYAFAERGSARYASEGETGAPSEGTAEYVDYATGDARLGFERYTRSGSWEVSVGRRVAEHELDVFPGSDRPT
jgi:Domain of unknown function (DUF4178)